MDFSLQDLLQFLLTCAMLGRLLSSIYCYNNNNHIFNTPPRQKTICRLGGTH